jgi:hypothetical protein
MADTKSELIKLLNFYDTNLPDNVINEIIAYYSFDNAKQRERDRAFKEENWIIRTRPDIPESYKARRGRIGGYVDYLDYEDIAYCDRVISEFNSLP